MRDLTASIDAAGRQSAEGCVKIWEDLYRYRHIITIVRPSLIVETGTFTGQSALWFAKYAGADVVTVDNDIPARALPEVLTDSRVACVRGDSVDPDTVYRVHALSAGYRTVMVVLDADHSATHVRAELDAYASLVTPGSYLVVEDTICRWLTGPIVAPYDGTPADAIDSWLPTHPDFTADRALEDMYPCTQHPGGWLRRAA